MVEHLAFEHGDFSIVFYWENRWYKIPFFVFEDLVHEWGNNRIINEHARRRGHDLSPLNTEEGPSMELRNWLETATNENNDEVIEQLKTILKDHLQDFSAFIWHGMEEELEIISPGELSHFSLADQLLLLRPSNAQEKSPGSLTNTAAHGPG